MPTMQRTRQWLIRALGLLSGEAPTVLDSTATPVVDIVQGGAGDADWSFLPFTIPTNAALVTTTLLAADQLSHRLVMVSLVKIGAAGPITFRLFSDGPNGLTVSFTWWELVALTTARNIGWQEIGGGQRFISLPPGFTLKLNTSAMTAPDSVTARAIVCTVPKGFKIW